jgi:hypothetical protein
MPIREDQIPEADADELIPLDIPFKLRDGSTETLSLKYRPLTEERTFGKSLAAQLAAVVAEWNAVDAEDKPVAPDYAYFAGKPTPYLQKLTEAISGDFFRRGAS